MTDNVLNPQIQMDDSLEDGVIIANRKTCQMLIKLMMDYQEMEEVQ